MMSRSVQQYASEASEIHKDLGCRNELERIAVLRQVALSGRASKMKGPVPGFDESATPGTPESEVSETPEIEGEGADAELLHYVPERLRDIVQVFRSGENSLRILQ